MYKKKSRKKFIVKSHNTDSFRVLLVEAWEHFESHVGQPVIPRFSYKHQVTRASFIPGPVFVKGRERELKSLPDSIRKCK